MCKRKGSMQLNTIGKEYFSRKSSTQVAVAVLQANTATLGESLAISSKADRT
jgi:hypothetical protein